jgi:hypothetical protein
LQSTDGIPDSRPEAAAVGPSCHRGDSPDNSFIESFYGKFRTECLNATWL